MSKIPSTPDPAHSQKSTSFLATVGGVVIGAGALKLLLGSSSGGSQSFIRWLMGDRAARVIGAGWNWLWGRPIEAGGPIALEVAQASLKEIQQSIYQLTESVAQISASHRKIQEKFEEKQRAFEQAEQRALLAQRHGNAEAARSAMRQAVTFEKLLPSLREQLQQSQQILTNQQDHLNRERQRLETYKLELQNIRDLNEINDALSTVKAVQQNDRIYSARQDFELARDRIQTAHFTTTAQAEALADPALKLDQHLDEMMLDDEIEKRLKLIDESSD